MLQITNNLWARNTDYEKEKSQKIRNKLLNSGHVLSFEHWHQKLWKPAKLNIEVAISKSFPVENYAFYLIY